PDAKPLDEPKFEKGKEYEPVSAKDVRPQPKFSRRAQLAGHITGPENKRFARAAANHIYAMLLGRGIVNTIDYDTQENPPSTPELLNLLADEFAKAKYDLKYLIREVMLTKTYQRSSLMPAGVDKVPENTFAVAILRPLSPEQLSWSMMQATGLAE